jgi:hypothetical protein
LPAGALVSRQQVTGASMTSGGYFGALATPGCTAFSTKAARSAALA